MIRCWMLWGIAMELATTLQHVARTATGASITTALHKFMDLAGVVAGTFCFKERTVITIALSSIIAMVCQYQVDAIMILLVMGMAIIVWVARSTLLAIAAETLLQIALVFFILPQMKMAERLLIQMEILAIHNLQTHLAIAAERATTHQHAVKINMDAFTIMLAMGVE